jgi:hypothetical protein
MISMPRIGLRGVDEPLHLLELLLARERGGLELLVDPAFGRFDVGPGGAGGEQPHECRGSE